MAGAIGVAQRRLEGGDKVSGRTAYVADVRVPGALHAEFVTSPYAHARVNAIERAAAQAMPGVVGVFSADEIGSLGLLAQDEVFYAGQPVAVVVADDRRAAADAAQAVRVRYERLAAIVDPRSALVQDAASVLPAALRSQRADAGAHGADAAQHATSQRVNVCGEAHFKRGDVDEGMRLADVVVEGRYRIPALYQGYLEPHGTVAVPEGDGLTIYTTTQGQFAVREEVCAMLGLPEHRVRVVAMTVGGGFGAKFVKLEPLVAALALRLRQPVRMLLSRSGDFLLSRPGTFAEIDVRLGARRDGSLTALAAELLFDAGAQEDGTVGVAAMLLGSTYRVPHLLVDGVEVLTHKTPTGAYRAPGAPQAYYALESAMDELARRLGQDPFELRLRSAVQMGDPRANGSPWPRIGLVEVLEAARSHPFWRERKKGEDEGYGVAAGGWPGGTEPAAAACRINGDGSITVQVGSVDLTGTNTTFAQIAAEVFAVPTDAVHVAVGDTDAAPYSGSTGGSKITFTVGNAVLQAAQEARQQVLELAGQELEASPSDLEMADGRVFVRGAPTRGVAVADLARRTTAFGGGTPPLVGRGRIAIKRAAPGFAVHVARVRVDRRTGEVVPLGYLAVQDVGRTLNPMAVAGQIRGGVAQSIGRALAEEMRWGDSGQLLSSSFLDYALPRAADVPPIEVALVEVPAEQGPFGAKGVGEPPAVPGAPAIVNAVADATGARLRDLPLRPEAVLRALAEVER